METGHILSIDDGQGFSVFVPFTHTSQLKRSGVTDVFIDIPDPRRHSPQQHKKVFGLLGEIARWSCGYTNPYTMRLETEYIRAELTREFCLDMGIEIFSMSNVDMTTCSAFIDYLVQFCVKWDVPCQDNSLLGYCEDVSRYLYSCLANRKCALCGKKADVHHVDAIGMGGDRREKPQLGARCIALCRKHHSECHTTGNETFLTNNHVYGIKLDEHLCECLKIPK